ncbi:MAG: response regulator [Leptospirales bacterium]|nr:response regulator [Leptospirales bacterium]
MTGRCNLLLCAMQAPVALVDDDPSIVGLITRLLESRYRNLPILQLGTLGEARRHLLELDPAPCLLILDWTLPDGEGVSLLRELKANTRGRLMPVIMLTAHSEAEFVRQGIAAGAFYYLTKPVQPPLLLATVGAAFDQFRALQQSAEEIDELRMAVLDMERGEFRVQRPPEALRLSRWLSHLESDPARLRFGLMELLTNAIEHGNLEISYQQKSSLLRSNELDDFLQARLEEAPYSQRYATLRFWREGPNKLFEIEDMGQGFDHRPYLTLSADRAFDLHGRGIALAREHSFAALDYQGAGNIVRATSLGGGQPLAASDAL